MKRTILSLAACSMFFGVSAFANSPEAAHQPATKAAEVAKPVKEKKVEVKKEDKKSEKKEEAKH